MSSLWAGEPAANPRLIKAWSADGGLKKRHDAESGQSIARRDRKALPMAWQLAGLQNLGIWRCWRSERCDAPLLTLPMPKG